MRRINRPSIAGLLLLLSLALGAVGASAATVSISVEGIESIDGRDAAGNTLLTIDLAAALGTASPVQVSAIGWNVGIESVGASWLSEATIGFEDTNGNALVDLRPGIDDTFAGSSNYDSGGLIALMELSFVVNDGLLILNFHETFDDVAGVADAIWSGGLTIEATPVPLPAAGWLLMCALGALNLTARGRDPHKRQSCGSFSELS